VILVKFLVKSMFFLYVFVLPVLKIFLRHRAVFHDGVTKTYHYKRVVDVRWGISID
jgi:hypothetical protein